MSVGRDMRARPFRTVQSFSLREMNTFGAPSLITRNTNDVQQVQMFTQMALTIMITAPLMAVGGVSSWPIRQDGPLSLLLLVIMPGHGRWSSARSWCGRSRCSGRCRSRSTGSTCVLREKLTGIRVIRAFVRTEHEEQRFAVANDDLTDTTLRVNRLFALMLPALMLIMNLSSVAVVWFGGHRVASGDMPVGNLMAFMTYLMQILFVGDDGHDGADHAAAGGRVVRAHQRGSGRAARRSTTRSVPRAGEPTPRGTVEFRDVDVRLPGRGRAGAQGHLLHRAARASTTAIIGSTGSGKSTLVNLIPRLYDVTGGSVLVDGVDVRERARPELWAQHRASSRRRRSCSPGRSPTTCASGLRTPPTTSSGRRWRSPRARSSYGRCPSGLEAPIEQGGVNVSGGQRQRLAIARALVRRALGLRLRRLVLGAGLRHRRRACGQALRRADRDAGLIVVAQRVATIRHADQILVLDEGRLVGDRHPRAS